MTQFGYALVGLTAIVAMIVAVMTFAILRVIAGARDAHRSLRDGGANTVMLSAALQEAVGKLKAQEQAMSARAEASDLLRGQIADSLTSGLLVVDAARRVEVLNPAGRRLLNLSSDRIGAPYADVLAGASPLADVISECLAAGKPIVRRSVEMQNAMKGMHFGVTVSPLEHAGDNRGAICLFSDLTSVIELEEQLRLKETLARLGELTAGIAHEFRNGLATIHGYSRLLDPEALPAKYRPYVVGIRQEAEALGTVVTNFLNFARPQQMSFGPVDLGRIARRAADELQRELPSGTRVDVAGDFAEIGGDEVLLRQVFGNLVRNAAEASESKGLVPIIAITGQIDRTHGTCRVTVEDNGPGIPLQDREKVFRPFFTTRSRGTGLGLAIVQKIVLTHHGRVAIGSSPAGGASIELTFRLNPPERISAL
jgi:nitrogen fixation/metabolism regulation signal transduction histidine kinase